MVQFISHTADCEHYSVSALKHMFIFLQSISIVKLFERLEYSMTLYTHLIALPSLFTCASDDTSFPAWVARYSEPDISFTDCCETIAWPVIAIIRASRTYENVEATGNKPD